jgi:rod shape determining protein RodA
VGFAAATLVVATLLLDKDLLAIILTIIAGLVVFFNLNKIKRDRGLLLKIILIWIICVGVQRFGVPFMFKDVFGKHQVERIYSTIGKDIPPEYLKGEEKIDVKTRKTIKNCNRQR